jgi:hypothetical protein
MVSVFQWLVPKQVRETLAVLLGAVAMGAADRVRHHFEPHDGGPASRRQEMAVRSALGAARSRLARLLLTRLYCSP